MPLDLNPLPRFEAWLSNFPVAPGGRLPPERQLAELLRMSRADVRRALGVLEERGEVQRLVGRGTFMTPGENKAEMTARLIEATSPNAAMTARLTLEPELAALAATNATPEQLRALRRMAAGMREAGSWSEYAESDWRFHALIAESTANVLLAQMQELLNDVRRSVVWSHLETSSQRPEADYHSFDEHDAIVDAIAGRTPAKARTLMRNHLEATRDRLLEE